MSLGPTELIVILVIVLLLFGSTKLPKLARSLGQAQREFKHGTTDGLDDEPAEPTVAPPTVAPPTVSTPPPPLLPPEPDSQPKT